jgi:hypothetical protein
LIAGTISTQQPTLVSGQSWNDYHFYNRFHVANRFRPSQNCGGYETMSLGVVKGTLGGINYNREIITERLVSAGCLVHPTGITTTGPGALYMYIRNLPNTTTWEAYVWLGQWVQVDSYNMGWSASTYTEYGQEIWARNGTLANITVPVNFIHKAQVGTTLNTVGPYYDSVLPSLIAGQTTTQTNWPFHGLDNIYGDYTSISSCTNCTN